MQFTSHNHNVFLRKKEQNIFVEKIGVKFPERIRRESDILKILVSYPGIPQIISEDLLSSTPSLKLTYIEAKPFYCLENNELNFAAKQVAMWLRKFANSGYSLPGQINSKYSAQQRDNQMFQKVRTLAERINSKKILNCVHKVQKYQKRKRIHCAHRDFRIDHVFLDNRDVYFGQAT